MHAFPRFRDRRAHLARYHRARAHLARLLSAEFFYSWAFLVLSLAVLGLGFGALALRLVPRLRRDGAIATALVLAGILAVAGPVLVFRLGIDTALLLSDRGMMLRAAAAVVLLGAAFFLGGIVLAAFFRAGHRDIPRLYMADLVGAGLGVPAAILAMNAAGTPTAVAWGAVPFLAAAILQARRGRNLLPAALAVLAVAAGGRVEPLLEVRRAERAPVVYRHWDAMAKVKMYAFGGDYRGLNIDNVANSPVIPFDGDWTRDPERDYEEPFWDIDVGHLIRLFPECRFLSLGAGGGEDVLQALDYGAAEVHAVEVNGHLNRMMTVGDPKGYVVHDSTTVDSTGRVVTCAEYSGYIYRDPRVRVVTGDARTYVRRNPGRFDVIYSLSSNTWAALASGSFAFAENYLFTVEAFRDYWNALSDGGFLSMEHQVYMPRLVTEARLALEGLGVERPEDHIAVYQLPRLHRHVLLLSKRPLTDELRYRAYGPLTAERQEHIRLVYPPPDSLAANFIARIAENGWRAEADSARTDLSPATDDRPFVAQMGLWRNLTRESAAKVSPFAELMAGFPLTRLILVVILGAAMLIALPLTLLPALGRGPKLPPRMWLYFALIGVAFMTVEVALIQRYTLFLGVSSTSTAVVLMALLLASGVGSRFAGRGPAALPWVAIPLLLLLEAFILRPLTGRLMILPEAARVATTAIFIAPLGFFMGMPFPRGVLRVGELADWGFAVNGAASVVGGAAVMLVAFAWGLGAALLVAAGLYAAAGALLIAGRRG